MNPEIIKKVVSNIPVAGDVFITIEDGYAIYESGRIIEARYPYNIKTGDIVEGVYVGIKDENGTQKIIINIDHKYGNSITIDNFGKFYLGVERRMKIKEINSKMEGDSESYLSEP